MKIQTVEPLIQRIEHKITQLTLNRAKVRALHPDDPVAQSRFLSGLGVNDYEGGSSHSLIDEDLERAAQSLGDDYTLEKDKAVNEMAQFQALAHALIGKQNDEHSLAVTYIRFIEAAVNLFRIGLRPMLRLRQDLRNQLGLPHCCSIKVDVEQEVITVNGTKYQVDRQKAVLVNLLVEAKGRVVSSTDLNKHLALMGSRIDRLVEALRDKDRVPVIIMSKRGSGYWIPMD